MNLSSGDLQIIIVERVDLSFGNGAVIFANRRHVIEGEAGPFQQAAAPSWTTGHCHGMMFVDDRRTSVLRNVIQNE